MEFIALGCDGRSSAEEVLLATFYCFVVVTPTHLHVGSILMEV